MNDTERNSEAEWYLKLDLYGVYEASPDVYRAANFWGILFLGVDPSTRYGAFMPIYKDQQDNMHIALSGTLFPEQLTGNKLAQIDYQQMLGLVEGLIANWGLNYERAMSDFTKTLSGYSSCYHELKG